jgi:hypothetical protein
VHESSSSAVVRRSLSARKSSIYLLCLNHIGILTRLRVDDERRINVVDGSSDRIAVHGSNEFQRDHSGPRGKQFEDKSCSFLPHGLHSRAYSELNFDISNGKFSVYLPRCGVHPA